MLFINACVRKASRTQILAKCLLEKLGGSYEELRLESISFPKTDEEYLEKRYLLIKEKSMGMICSDLPGSLLQLI